MTSAAAFRAPRHAAAERLARTRLALAPVLEEILVNARRARASAITVTFENHPDPKTPKPYLLTVHDDGVGVADPRTLLDWGASRWAPASAEPASGYGFAALAGARCRLTSRTAGGAGWRMAPTPAAFTGDDTVVPQAAPHAPRGTAIAFATRLESAAVLDVLDPLCLYYPLPVFWEDRTTDPVFDALLLRRNFLDYTHVHRKRPGFNVGLYTTALRKPDAGNLNVHGRLLDVDLPALPFPGGTARPLIDLTVRPDFTLPEPGVRRPAAQPGLRRLVCEALRTASQLAADAAAQQPPAAP